MHGIACACRSEFAAQRVQVRADRRARVNVPDRRAPERLCDLLGPHNLARASEQRRQQRGLGRGQRRIARGAVQPSLDRIEGNFASGEHGGHHLAASEQARGVHHVRRRCGRDVERVRRGQGIG